ncbi:hypothetical protein BD408DRAFT_417567 [Parasitella parasitica]|nr:hypothetical protein BD408DRAFT_417567 [Parasitella parasitica]
MATLDAFLTRGKKKDQLLAQDTKVKHAFINPFTTAVKKPAPSLKASPKPAKSQSKTIAQYFTPMDVDVEMEEQPAEVCTIRHKMPVTHLWNLMQYELDQDPFYSQNFEQNERSMKRQETPIPTTASTHCSHRRRRRQSDTDQNTAQKRHKKTDNELSSIMTRFLMMDTGVKHRPTSMEFMDEFSEEIEDLTRPIRHKQTSQESQLFVHYIAQELLY